VVKSFSW